MSTSLAADGGWQVIIKVGDRIVAVKHCGDWHRVERLQARLQANGAQELDGLLRDDTSAVA
jgi:hypothetical protein